MCQELSTLVDNLFDLLFRHPEKQMKIRLEYEEAGTADAFYRDKGALYRNPQERDVRDMLRKRLRSSDLSSRVLDLAAGSGEVSLEVVALGGEATATDPFCWEACEQRTGRPCLRWSFEQIAAGEADFEADEFSCIVCSFALHLLDESYLPALLAVLSGWSKVLIVLTPHKRPHLRPEWGWILEEEHVENRVRLRRYKRKE